MSVDLVQNCYKEGLIGDNATLIGMKSPTSFLIGTSWNGLLLLEDKANVFSSELPDSAQYIRDIIYTPHLDSYFLAFNDKLYKKDIDDKPPYPFMNVNCGSRYGACLGYSTRHQRLIINKDSETISLLNTETRKLEVEMKKKVGNKIMDFRLLGKDEQRVVSLTGDGHIILYNLSQPESRGVVSYHRIKLLEKRSEVCRSLAACGEGKTVLVAIGGFGGCSRMLLFKFVDDNLMNVASIDCLGKGLRSKLALECFGSVDTHILWVGLVKDEGGPAQLYDYDIQTGELKELEDRRVVHHEYYPYKLHLLGDKLYYIGYYGRLMTLGVGNEQ